MTHKVLFIIIVIVVVLLLLSFAVSWGVNLLIILFIHSRTQSFIDRIKD